MNVWIVVLAAGIGSYLMRLSMIGADRIRLPASLNDSAGLVAPAAFAALAVSSIAGTVLDAGITQASAALVAVAAAVLAVARTGSAHAAVLVGMPTFWILTALTAA
jgi:branched-subunit amino acid transport protein